MPARNTRSTKVLDESKKEESTEKVVTPTKNTLNKLKNKKVVKRKRKPVKKKTKICETRNQVQIKGKN